MGPRTVPDARRRFARASLAIALAALLAGCGGERERPWNVLLVTFDTTRADRLGVYGNARIETPTVDGLARQGVVFDAAFSVAPITAPSHSSILTGRYPIAHGFRDNGLFVLGDSQLTLPEMLREHGYATAAAVGSYPVTAQFGFDQGFDLFDDKLTGRVEDHLGERVVPKERLFFDERRAAQVNEAILPWIETQATAGKPFFAWVHYFDPHQPFEPPNPFNQLYADDLYNGEIAYTDQSLGRLLRHLDRLGELDRTLVVMTADHGEGLGEHGELTHAMLAYNSTLRVPLVIRPPAALPMTGERVAERVGSVDIVPTVLALLGLPIPDSVQGRSLLPLLRGEAGEWRQYYAENLSPHLTHGWGKLRVLFDGALKYIHGPRPELYDLEADPDELRNLLQDEPDAGQRMHEELALFLAEFATGTSVTKPLDDEAVRRLQSLGYLQSGGANAATISEALEPGGVPPHEHVGLLNDMSAAKHLLFAQRYADAEIYTRKLIAASPDSPSYTEMHLAALTGSSRIDEAWAYLHADRDIAFQPSEPLLIGLALARHRQGHEDEALAALSAFAESACSARAHWTLAGLLASGENAEARPDALHRALGCDGRFAPARIDLAVWLSQQARDTEADEAFRQALRDAPYDARAHYNYGTFLVSGERLSEADAAFARAQELAPTYWKAHFARVAIAIDQGETERARALTERLRLAAPHSAETAAAQALLDAAGLPAAGND